jgi:hypothetical protein
MLEPAVLVAESDDLVNEVEDKLEMISNYETDRPAVSRCLAAERTKVRDQTAAPEQDLAVVQTQGVAVPKAAELLPAFGDNSSWFYSSRSVGSIKT